MQRGYNEVTQVLVLLLLQVSTPCMQLLSAGLLTLTRLAGSTNMRLM